MKTKSKRQSNLRGISYCRVSTFEQAFYPDGSIKEEGSPESQRKRCEEHIKYLNQTRAASGIKYEIIEHLYERGFSAKDTNRPAYKQMEQYIQSGRIQFVLATELSRLSRSVIDFLKLLELCRTHNVHVMVIGLDHFDTSTAIGKMLLVVLIALAAFERDMTSERVSANALIRLVRDKRINGGAAVLGLDRHPERKDQYVANPQGIKTVETLLRLFLKVSSKKKLLLMAKSMGLRGRKGGEITERELDYIFMNVKWRYRGLWFANIENVDSDDSYLPENKRFQIVSLEHGPVVDIGLLDQVQAKLADTYDKRKREGIKNYTYLLSNVLFYEDGTPMKGESAKKGTYRYYKSKKAKVSAYCEALDKKIIERLKLILVNNGHFTDLVEQAIRGRDLAVEKIEKEILKCEKELKRCAAQNSELRNQLLEKLQISSHDDSDFSVVSWIKEQVKALKYEQALAERQLANLDIAKNEVMERTGLASLREAVRKFVDGFEVLSGTEKRNLLEKIVRRVVLKKDNKVELYLAINPALSLPLPVIGRNQSSDKELNGVPERYPTQTRT